MKPICFVVMPYGVKVDQSGRQVDFDQVYADLIAPGIEKAGMEPYRSDQELLGGTIHKSMFERLMLCDYAVADLTSSNANVYYEVGMRHVLRPRSTILIVAKGSQLPFNVGPQRTMEYDLGRGGVPNPEFLQKNVAELASRLEAAREPHEDSPFYQYVSAWPRPDIAHLKADLFQEQVFYSAAYKARLQTVRANSDRDGAKVIETELGDIRDAEPGVVVDLFLTYRDLKCYGEMVGLAERMEKALAASVLIREQLAFALNRLSRRDEAENILKDVIQRHGPSSETFGLLGRVYKDRWQEAVATGRKLAAQGYLQSAIAAYRRGFEADWRDAFPGVNAVTLMDIAGDPDKDELLPVVRYAARQRLTQGSPDYWDYATLMELAVMADNERESVDMLMACLPKLRHSWMAETTIANLTMIGDARAGRGEATDWIMELVAELSGEVSISD